MKQTNALNLLKKQMPRWVTMTIMRFILQSPYLMQDILPGEESNDCSPDCLNIISPILDTSHIL